MNNPGKRQTTLSDAERQELYEVPAFSPEEGDYYLSLDSREMRIGVGGGFHIFKASTYIAIIVSFANLSDYGLRITKATAPVINNAPINL